MCRTTERIFKRLHADGLLTDHFPEDYKFYRHDVKRYDLEAGAMRWSMLPRDPQRITGPTITSHYTVNDICRSPVQRYTDLAGVHQGDFELIPAS